MLRKLLFVFIFPCLTFSQNFSELWTGYFSYYNIIDTCKGNNTIYAASENAIFGYNLLTGEIQEINTINGTSGDKISKIYYSENYQLLLIGYENGLIEIVFNDGTDVLSVVDITEKSNIIDNNKHINDFYEYENSIYISTDYGISVFDIERQEFGDTYFIGNNGSQIPVNQTVIFQNNIYAACGNGNGIKKASLTSTNLIDYKVWETPFNGTYLFIKSNEETVITLNNNRQLYFINNDLLSQILETPQTPNEITFDENNLVVSTENNIFIYDQNISLLSTISVYDEFPTSYTSVDFVDNQIFIGTQNFGVLTTTIEEPQVLQEIHPNGPLINESFSIKVRNNNLWVVHGSYSPSFGWNGGRRVSGISHSANGNWKNIPYDSIATQVSNPNYLTHISINPLKTDQVFISSFFSGLIEINDGEVNTIYDENNSTITPFVSDFCLTTTSKYDTNGVLWVMNSRVKNPLNKFQDEQWVSYDFTKAIESPQANNGFADLDIGDDGTKWIATSNFGIIGFNENNGNPLIKTISEEENLPSQSVRALALDRRNTLWIGTPRGLRVLFNTSSFFEDNVEVDPIIIEEDGIAQELLFEQSISDIEVDGSNNKWIGTFDSGIFYLSSDGQQTIFHFTKENSPLPSNTVVDIAIDQSNGEVYIATEKGLVSFRTNSSSPTENFTNSHAYPNPVRPGFNIVEERVKITDLPSNVNIKITDIEGNLVAEAQSRTNQRYNGFNLEIDGGTAFWNGKNLANNIVASGVYLIMLADLDSFETKVVKLMVVR
ncbi:MAG: two-component regulator propeller domain-containing protein [Jejuia sp.]